MPEKAEYAKTAEQLYKEELQAKDKDATPDEGRSFKVEGNDTDGYIGVSPEYQNYASDTEKPLTADEGPDVEIVETFLDVQDALVSKPAEAATDAETTPDDGQVKSKLKTPAKSTPGTATPAQS